MDEGLDLNKVLDKSASSVSVEELSRKGFRTVKVLNRESIQRLILQAVDRVLVDRAEEIGREERDRIFAESRAEFDRLLAERMAREREGLVGAQEKLDADRAQVAQERDRLAAERASFEESRKAFEAERERIERTQAETGAAEEDLRRREEELARELEQVRREREEHGDLRETLTSLVAELRAPAAQGPAGGFSEIREMIECLGRKIAAGPGGVPGMMMDDSEALAAASLAISDEKGVESNLANVEVKQAKKGGVRGTLAKLKSLKAGGEGGAAGQ
ncbi:MAG: hypothetical protein JXP34_03675 [Planctomycetes bacterium]|nr:hypothetical protein [Planctomycetota bacterium]